MILMNAYKLTCLLHFLSTNDEEEGARSTVYLKSNGLIFRYEFADPPLPP